MNTRLHLSLIAVLALGSATAQAQQGTGALGVPANHIVGLWSTHAEVRPCGTGVPTSPVLNTLLFMAGGTLYENPRSPPAGINGEQRSPGIGTWTYDPSTKGYTVNLRFDRFVGEAYAGYATVERHILLSSDGHQAAGSVHAIIYAADGSTVVELCGEAVSQRL
jgi:hypothetical protein